MKKILILIICLFISINIVNAKVDNVSYEITDYIVDSSIDISGNLLVKEVIKMEGTYNGYIRDILYKNSNLKEFDNTLDSFESSSIYNATNIELKQVGIINYNKELDYNVFNEEISSLNTCSDNTTNNCYITTDIDDGISIKMYNETNNNVTYFYIEYLLGNLVVLHNDVAELYYNFIGNNFSDNIDRYRLRVLLPSTTTKDNIKVWAHGQLNGEVMFIAKDDVYYGAYLSVTNLNKNTPLDLRMTFDKNLILVSHPFQKLSNTDALDSIIKVETKKADEANSLRKQAKIITYATYIIDIIYIILTILIIIYIYIKYDKEIKVEFNNEYYRDFIDDYDVIGVEYLFKKNITDTSFSTSILNLIYKKNILVEELSKKDYIFILNNKDNLTNHELKLIDILFTTIGKNNEVTLKEIKDYSKKNTSFYKEYTEWKDLALSYVEDLNFYIDNTKIKLYFILYSFISFIIYYLYYKINIFNILTLITIILTITLVIYVLTFTKRTRRGSIDYTKWKAFKKFLNDFGRFNEKELPEIILWEKYLVYANIFGLADKVSKTMKIKYNEYTEYNDINNNLVFNILLWDNLNTSINRSISTSINNSLNITSTTISSGSGFGGGFSSGGGFGGGGGGGRGF